MVVKQDTCNNKDGRVTRRSYDVFLKFVRYFEKEDGTVRTDASGLLSKECYREWLTSRKSGMYFGLSWTSIVFIKCLVPRMPGEAFRRALTAHCRGIDQRRPFPEDIEASLLIELRKKRRWPCFDDNPDVPGLIGIQGFLSKGFHESRARRRVNSTQTSSMSALGTLNRKRKRVLDDSIGFAPYTSFFEFYGALKPSCYNISEKTRVLYSLPFVAERRNATTELVQQLNTGNCNTSGLLNLWPYFVSTIPGRLTTSNLTESSISCRSIWLCRG